MYNPIFTLVYTCLQYVCMCMICSRSVYYPRTPEGNMWLFSWVMLHYVHWLVDNIIRVLFGSDQVGCSWFSFRLQLLIVVRRMQQRRTCESKTFCKDKLYHLKCLSLGFSLLLHFHRPPLLFPTPLPAPGWQLR